MASMMLLVSCPNGLCEPREIYWERASGQFPGGNQCIAFSEPFQERDPRSLADSLDGAGGQDEGLSWARKLLTLQLTLFLLTFHPENESSQALPGA